MFLKKNSWIFNNFQFYINKKNDFKMCKSSQDHLASKINFFGFDDMMVRKKIRNKNIILEINYNKLNNSK